MVMAFERDERRLYNTLLDRSQDPCCWAVCINGIGILGHTFATEHNTSRWFLMQVHQTDPDLEVGSGLQC